MCIRDRRYDADFRTVERLLEAGPLGTLARFESCLLYTSRCV